MNSSATVTADLEARQAAWRFAPARKSGAERGGACLVGAWSDARELASVGTRAASQDADRIALSMPRLW